MPTTHSPVIEMDDNPSNAAACLVSCLEARGGIFTIDADGHLRANLDPIQAFGSVAPEMAIRAVLGLAEPIKAGIRARHTLH